MYRVIIADDEPDICAGMRTLIDWEALGFEVAGTAENGLQAMELEEELKADLVITDIRMPLMDGLELARRLKSSSADIQVVILSGYRDFAYAKRAISQGSAIICSPVDTEELAGELRKIKLTLDQLHTSMKEYTLPEEDGSPESAASEILAYIDAHYREKPEPA